MEFCAPVNQQASLLCASILRRPSIETNPTYQLSSRLSCPSQLVNGPQKRYRELAHMSRLAAKAIRKARCVEFDKRNFSSTTLPFRLKQTLTSFSIGVNAMVDLYLNYDGVLHPNKVRFSGNGSPRLLTPGHELFEHNSLLVSLVEHQDVHIILNTWWVHSVGFNAALKRLPTKVRPLVAGTTLQQPEPTASPTFRNRALAMAAYIRTRDIAHAVILDSADSRWPARLLPFCLLLDPTLGLSDAECAQAFAALCRRVGSSTKDIRKHV